ncbi:MAG: hypothetical protein AB7S70_12070 [Hyphomicrobium sp.]|uniref:hypothetical protein n=1 Tax=Hyphomicrobium sp. TaxID=82 RepID=UPI003D0FE8F6
MPLLPTDTTRRALADARGRVSIPLALIASALALAGSAALEYTHVAGTQSDAQSAAGAAASTAGWALGQGRSDDELKVLAERSFKANLHGLGAASEIDGFSVAIDRKGGLVKVDARVKAPMFLARPAGIPSLDLPAEAESVVTQRDIELALVLDVTGSMNLPESKIDYLRAAAGDLVELLLPSAGRPGRVRIALAPFSAAVNAGPYFSAVTGRSDGAACVVERNGTSRFAEIVPTSASPIGYEPDVHCPDVAVQPLTSDKTLLEDKIARLTAGGPGAGHIGAAWGWYLLSPRWSGIWPSEATPADYDARKTIKAMLLMADGEFNAAYVRENGSSAVQTRELCANMKRRGVTVFAIGYLIGRSAERLLQSCASSSSHYFTAWSGPALSATFQAVGRSLTNLRKIP